MDETLEWRQPDGLAGVDEAARHGIEAGTKHLDQIGTGIGRQGHDEGGGVAVGEIEDRRYAIEDEIDQQNEGDIADHLDIGRDERT